MEDKPKTPEQAIEELEGGDTTELENEDLEDVSGGGPGVNSNNINCCGSCGE